jgi:hypothetical protein
VASNILLFFLQKEKKRKEKNNKILPATSACFGAVVRNECMDHFSKIIVVFTSHKHRERETSLICLKKNSKTYPFLVILKKPNFYFIFIIIIIYFFFFRACLIYFFTSDSTSKVCALHVEIFYLSIILQE